MKTHTINLKFACWSLLLLMSMSFPTIAAHSVSTEYKLKAALIYKLTKFVDWPVVASDKSHKDFGICVLGRDDFGSALDALEERLVGDADISVRRFSQSDGMAEHCQLVFISDSKKAFFKSILRVLGKHPILTISDSKHFARQGGMIQLTRGEQRIGFKINLQSAKNAGLKIAAPLLGLATIVNSKSQGYSK